MRLLLTKILLLVAYSFVLTHTVIPHHHDDPKEAVESHHDDGRDYNIFSFGQIDGSFLPAQKESIKHYEYISQFVFCLYDFTIILSSGSFNNVFPVLEEFPPPKNYFYFISFRAPPVL